MKKKNILIILAILAIITTGYIFVYKISSKLDIDLDIDECKIISENDKHQGFHGDGDFILKADCSKNNKKILKQVKKWKRMPLSENLQLIMYGGERDNKTYGYELAKKNNIPEIKNGYYYYIDRDSDATNIHSDLSLFDRYSFNFTIVMYDLDTNILYYYEFDT